MNRQVALAALVSFAITFLLAAAFSGRARDVAGTAPQPAALPAPRAHRIERVPLQLLRDEGLRRGPRDVVLNDGGAVAP